MDGLARGAIVSRVGLRLLPFGRSGTRDEADMLLIQRRGVREPGDVEVEGTGRSAAGPSVDRGDRLRCRLSHSSLPFCAFGREDAALRAFYWWNINIWIAFAANQTRVVFSASYGSLPTSAIFHESQDMYIQYI